MNTDIILVFRACVNYHKLYDTCVYNEWSVKHLTYILCSSYYTASNFCAGVACRLGVKIIRHAMNYHRSTENIGYIKAISCNRHIGVPVAVH